LREYLTQKTKGVKKRKFCCKKSKGHNTYYIDGKYVSKLKHLDKITAMSTLEYEQELLKELDNVIPLLENTSNIHQLLENPYYKLHDGKKILIDPEIKPVSLLIDEFNNEEFTPKEFDEDDNSAYFTNRGERVRSKSEKIIADELLRLNIPYHYEKPLEIYMGKKKIIFHPDFTVMNRRTGKIYYWEHLGLIEKGSYFDSTIRKFDLYENNNLLIGEDVILSFETSYAPLNTNMVTTKILDYLF
nr:hypothetical protein [Lachnospiraceae bacterium]